MMPLQPKWPRSPVFAGMYGCQFAVSTYLSARQHEHDDHADLQVHHEGVRAGRLLHADVQIQLITATMRMAGTLMMAPVACHCLSNGAFTSCAGR